MVLDEKYRKTGGSCIVFILYRIVFNEKKIVLAAALPGVFFKGQKCKDFKAYF
jgi:hypothetical protein